MRVYGCRPSARVRAGSKHRQGRCRTRGIRFGRAVPVQPGLSAATASRTSRAVQNREGAACIRRHPPERGRRHTSRRHRADRGGLGSYTTRRAPEPRSERTRAPGRAGLRRCGATRASRWSKVPGDRSDSTEPVRHRRCRRADRASRGSSARTRRRARAAATVLGSVGHRVASPAGTRLQPIRSGSVHRAGPLSTPLATLHPPPPTAAAGPTPSRDRRECPRRPACRWSRRRPPRSALRNRVAPGQPVRRAARRAPVEE